MKHDQSRTDHELADSELDRISGGNIFSFVSGLFNQAEKHSKGVAEEMVDGVRDSFSTGLNIMQASADAQIEVQKRSTR